MTQADAWRRSDVERAIEPDAALRKSHLVGEHAGPVVNTVAVRVGEEEDAVGQFLFEPGLVEVRPARVPDEKLPAPAKGGHEGMVD